MGCNTSRDAMPPRRARRRRADPVKLCRERAALARAVADRRSALADAHAAYFRSLPAVAGALRGFAANALAAATESSPSPPSAVSSPLSRSSRDENHNAAPRPNDPELGGGGGDCKKASSSPTATTMARRYTRSSSTVHMVVCENPYASPWYAEREATYGEAFAQERPAPSPPTVPPWDYFDPFAHCDGFAEDYYYNDRSREHRKTVEADDASSKPSSSTVGADRNGKASTGDPLGGANGEVEKGKRPASSNSINGCSKKGVKKSRASLNLKGSVPASSGANGEKGNEASSKYAGPCDASSRRKQEPSNKTTGAAGGKPAAPSPAAISSPPLSSPSSHVVGTRSVTAAMDEVYWLFIEAANRGAAVSRVLGTTGKAAVTRRRRSKLRLVVTASTSSCHPKPRRRRRRSTSSSSSSLGTGRSNDVHKLSSTLEKLWVWEKKLYGEMKEKEKLLKQYRNMHRRLKSLDRQGAESPAIDATQMSINLLRSKISVSTATVTALSSMVAKVRDEELYPQLADLVRRFRALWKAVLDCHEKQLSAVLDSDILHHRRLNKAAVTLQSRSGVVASTAYSEELERELVNWQRCLENWIGSQKSFVEALNSWLIKTRLPPDQVQEDGGTTPHGGVPLQPPSFVIAKQWLQATEKVSITEALRATDRFAKHVREFRKSQEDEHRLKQRADRASREYHAKREDLKAEFGLVTELDTTAVMDNPCHRQDDRVRDLVKARRRRDEERTRHEKILRQADSAASATLPLGLVPMLRQIACFFQGSLRAYAEIRFPGTA